MEMCRCTGKEAARVINRAGDMAAETGRILKGEFCVLGTAAAVSDSAEGGFSDVQVENVAKICSD